MTKQQISKQRKSDKGKPKIKRKQNITMQFNEKSNSKRTKKNNYAQLHERIKAHDKDTVIFT
jgi:hypothetical protein